jgi:putative salt-induced outer membrane protein YdiY
MRLIVSFVVLLSVGTVVRAQQISLKNGDRLSGVIVSMDGKKLVIKTTYEGEVSIDWDSVEQLTSDHHLVVTTKDKNTMTGTVTSEGANLVITTPHGGKTIAKSDVAQMRPVVAGVGWSGGGNFGLALARGNSETTNLALGFDAERKTEKDAWIVNAASIYSTDTHLNRTTANAFQGLIRYDRNLTKLLFAYAVFAGGYDELQDLNYRLMPGGGLGFHAITNEKTTLDLLGGFGYTRESYSTGLNRNLATLTLGDEFSYKLSTRTTIVQNFYYLPSLNDTSNYRITGNLGITTKLNNWMTANVLLNDRYNSQPVLGNRKNDVLFTTGLGIAFGAKPK